MQLLRAARRGDTAARAALIARHLPLARGLVRRRLGSDYEAEDIAQEAVAQALESLESLRNGQAFVSWFGSLVMRTTCKNLRSRGLRRRGLHTYQEQCEPAIVAWRPDDALELRRYAEREPTRTRCLVLHALEGRSLPETAAVVGVSLSTLKRRINSVPAEDECTGIAASSSAA